MRAVDLVVLPGERRGSRGPHLAEDLDALAQALEPLARPGKP